MIHVKDKDLVVPGEILAEDDHYSGRGTFSEGSRVCSALTGLVSLRNKKISVIPIKSKYIPKRGDVVIGEIDDIRFSMWGVDINSPYSGILPASEVFGREKKELRKVFNIGDVLFLRIVDVDEIKKVKLGLKGRGMGKFQGGILTSITPTKVPRLIGKKGSMINMIKNKTNCKIVVGQNGLVWIRGEENMEIITKNIIALIEAEAHTSGLTNRVKDKLYLLVDGKLPEDTTDIYLENNINDVNQKVPVDNELNDNNSYFHKSSKIGSVEFDENGLEKPKIENFKEELELENNDNSDSDFNKTGSNPKKVNYLDSFNHIKKQKVEDTSSVEDTENNNHDVPPTVKIPSNLNRNSDSKNKRKFTFWKKDTE
jgi:exosome complex component RRP4